MARTSHTVFWLAVSRITALAILFLVYTKLLRYLGPEVYGQYESVLSFVTIFGVVIDFGVQNYVTKKISENQSDARKYFHNFLVVEVFLSLLVYGGLLVGAYISGYRGNVFAAIGIAGLGTAINGLTYPYLAVMSSFLDLRRVAIINFLNSIINAGVLITGMWLGKGIVFFAANQIIFGVIALFIYSRFVRRHLGPAQAFRSWSRFEGGLLKTMLLSSLSFALLVGFSTVYNKIDMVLVSRILGFEAAGQYGAAYRFFNLIAFFPAVVSHSLYPVFSSLMAAKEILQVRQKFEDALRYMLAMAIPIGVGGSIMALPFILVVGGSEYVAAVPALRVLAWAPVVLCVYIVANSLVISQLTRRAVIITGANVLVNIVGNLLLLPVVGILGAAIMTLVSETLQAAYYFYSVKKHITDFSIWSSLWRPIVAGTVMGLGIWQMYTPLFPGGEVANFSTTVLVYRSLLVAGLGAVIYVLCLALLGFFNSSERARIRKMLPSF